MSISAISIATGGIVEHLAAARETTFSAVLAEIKIETFDRIQRKVRPEVAQGSISAAPSVPNSHSDLSRRFTSGYDLSAASPPSIRVLRHPLKRVAIEAAGANAVNRSGRPVRFREVSKAMP